MVPVLSNDPKMRPFSSTKAEAKGAAGTGQGDLDLLHHPGRPAAEHDDPVGEQNGLLHVVRHEQDGTAQLAVETREPLLQPAAGLGVQSAERFVEGHNVALGEEGPQERSPLAHPSGKLSRIRSFEIFQAEEGKPLTCLRLGFFLGTPCTIWGRMMLSRVRRQGNSRSAWGM